MKEYTTHYNLIKSVLAEKIRLEYGSLNRWGVI